MPLAMQRLSSASQSASGCLTLQPLGATLCHVKAYAASGLLFSTPGFCVSRSMYILPKGWPLIIIDLKVCSFTIPLQEKYRKNLPSTVILIIILSLLGYINGLSSHGDAQ